MPKPLPIPIRPMINRILARRGLALGPVRLSGFEGSIYRALPAGAVSTIFDVGANIGLSAASYHASFPFAQIYCFEPIPTTFRKLVANTKSNRERISCFNLALGHEEGKVRMRIFPENDQMSKVVVGTSDHEMHSKDLIVDNVTMTSVDEFCSINGITRVDLIKTDTEGYDINVLKGAKHMLQSCIRFVLCEIGFNASDTQHTPFEDVFRYLDPLNFRYRGSYGTVYDEHGVAFYSNALFVHS